MCYLELLKMFHLVDRVANGVEPMITHLEDHVIATGLMEMMDAAATITTVCDLIYTEQNLLLTFYVIFRIQKSMLRDC